MSPFSPWSGLIAPGHPHAHPVTKVPNPDRVKVFCLSFSTYSLLASPSLHLSCEPLTFYHSQESGLCKYPTHHLEQIKHTHLARVCHVCGSHTSSYGYEEYVTQRPQLLSTVPNTGCVKCLDFLLNERGLSQENSEYTSLFGKC